MVAEELHQDRDQTVTCPQLQAHRHFQQLHLLVAVEVVALVHPQVETVGQVEAAAFLLALRAMEIRQRNHLMVETERHLIRNKVEMEVQAAREAEHPIFLVAVEVAQTLLQVQGQLEHLPLLLEEMVVLVLHLLFQALLLLILVAAVHLAELAAQQEQEVLEEAAMGIKEILVLQLVVLLILEEEAAEPELLFKMAQRAAPVS